ncbi:Hypothetical protein HVPorG_03980b [Roseomonas mucosa]|nr:Hypothetical protein HVPorG_03980b [Roseomonas mucosa]
MVAASLRPDPGKQVETRGSRKEERHPVRAGGTGSPPESDALRRDPAGSEEATNGRSRNLRFLADKGDGGKRRSLVPRDGATPKP